MTPSSRSWASLTSEGASVIRSVALAVFGKAMTSRMEGSPARIEMIRSRPRAMPPWGGVPACSASRKKPKRLRASSSEIESSLKIRAWRSESWIRMLPPRSRSR